MRRRSLRTQIATGTAILTLLVTAIAGIVIITVITGSDRSDVDRALVTRSTRVAADAAKLVAQPPVNDGDEYGPLLSGSDSLVRLIADGQVVAERGQIPKSTLPVPTAEGFFDISIAGVPWRGYAQTVSGRSRIRVEVLTSLAPLQSRLASNELLIGLVSVAATIAAGGGSWFGARLILRPLSRLRSEASEARAAHDADFRLPPVAGPVEVAELSDTLNDMLERLSASSAATRQFTADAGHELRTPLTSLGAYIETLQRNPEMDAATRNRIVDEMTVEHARLVSLLAGLQALARGDARAFPSAETVNLSQLVADAVTQAQRHFPHVHISDASAGADATVVGWADGLRMAIDNLLANAALHGRPDGNVVATVSFHKNRVDVSVVDDGPGMTPSDRQTLVKRFARGDTETPGSGLGLALVTQQAELHGGELVLESTQPQGLTAVLRLPIRAT